MNKVLETIGALTLGSALVGGGMLYGGALGVIAATDKKTAEKTFYGKVLVRSIENRRKLKRPYISYANLAKAHGFKDHEVREVKKEDWGNDTGVAEAIAKTILDAEKRINKQLKDLGTVTEDDIVKAVRKELGLDRTDKWPFFSMTEEEQR